jgi:hypothetical protein
MEIKQRLEAFIEKSSTSASTGHLLNYFTLSMKNEQCREALLKHRDAQFERVFWPLFYATWFGFFVTFYEVFVMKSMNPLLLVSAGLVQLIVVMLSLFKKFGRMDLFDVFPLAFLLI